MNTTQRFRVFGLPRRTFYCYYVVAIPFYCPQNEGEQKVIIRKIDAGCQKGHS